MLALTTGLALLLLAALLWGSQGLTPVRADAETRYVDGATGSDDTDCDDPADPCATIGYALSQAGNGDEILVAAGTYPETVDVAGNPLTLRGGYTVSGAVWLAHSGETVVDAGGADDAVFWIEQNAAVTIEGFTVQGADHTSDNGGGFIIEEATAIINVTVSGNDSATGVDGALVRGPVSGFPIVNSIFWASGTDGSNLRQIGLTVGTWKQKE